LYSNDDDGNTYNYGHGNICNDDDSDGSDEDGNNGDVHDNKVLLIQSSIS